jgi:hypothetical protein
MLANPLSAIRAARPALSLFPRAIVEAICLVEGTIGSADRVAQRLGLRNRFELARLLRREGLPPLHRIAGWATVLSWVVAAERDGVSLCRMAFRTRRFPGACYRMVKEVTGLYWEEVREQGSGWVEREFLRELQATRVPSEASPTAPTASASGTLAPPPPVSDRRALPSADRSRRARAR